MKNKYTKKNHAPSPHNDELALKNAIDYIAPLCTAIKFSTKKIKSSSRKIEVLIQRALLCHHLRKHNKLSLYRVRDIMHLKAHATVINLLHFYEGKSNRPYRQYYLHIINMVFSQTGDVQIKFSKEVNEKFLAELAKPKERKQYASKKKSKTIIETSETNPVLQGGEQNPVTDTTSEASADCQLPLPTATSNINQSEIQDSEK